MLQGNIQSVSLGLTSSGMIEVDFGSSFAVGGTLNMTMGEIRNQGTLSASGGVVSSSGTVNLGGLVNTPKWTQNGGVISAGSSSVGIGTITGNLNLGPLSYLAVDIIGAAPNEVDRFQVNGSATVAGSIDLRIPSGVVLPEGSALTIVSSNSPVFGGFANVPVGFALTNPGNTLALQTLSNVGPLTPITGSITLQDFQPNPFGQVVTFSFFKNGTPMGSTNAVIDESGQYLLNTHLRGSFDMAADIGSWLKRKRMGGVNIGETGLTGVNFVLQNGDVDRSGEVDAADIDEVIANFGNTYPTPGGGNPDTDVDGSSEVDAADIDIVIANFGATDD